MDELKVNFTFFWNGFDKKDNFLTRLLSTKYKVTISDRPDILFCLNNTDGTKEYLKFNCHKVFINMENERMDWTAYDYALGPDYIRNNPRYKRWPLWAHWDIKQLTKAKDPKQILASKSKFACMVVSNPNCKERNHFFHQLSKYKKVDSGGRYLNNVGGPVSDKMGFIKDYKFVLSFENSSCPGYTTEKLIEPMLVNSLPVYWGNFRVEDDFNTKSFINTHDFKTFDEAIGQIIDLDRHPEKYLAKFREPWFKDNRIPPEFTPQKLLNFLDFLITNSKSHPPVCRTYKRHIHAAKSKIKSLLWLISKKNLSLQHNLVI